MKRATKELLLERATKNKEESKYKDYPCDALGSALTIKRCRLRRSATSWT